MHIDKLYKSVNQEMINGWINERTVRLNLPGVCNLNCSYCVSKHRSERGAITNLGINKYIKRIMNLFGKYMPFRAEIVAEGDPLDNPNFIPLLNVLFEKGCNIKVLSNLGGSIKLYDFAHDHPEGDMTRIEINSSYHLGAYLDKSNGAVLRDEYLDKHIPRVTNLGFKLGGIIIPMTPKVCMDVDFVNDCKYLKSFGFKIQPVELVGMYNGKKYPESYNDEESKALIEKRNIIYGNKKMDSYMNRCDSKEQLPYFTRELHLKGKPCGISIRFCMVLADGYIYNCFAELLGNIQDSNYKEIKVFNDKPQPCPVDECSCRTIGFLHSLNLYDITYKEYYEAYYLDLGKPKISEYFKKQ